jgi:hypothetical protein
VNRKPGQPIERTEETLEVGLDRYRKQERRVPNWLVDYGLWIFLGFLSFVVILPFTVFGSRSLFGGDAPVPQGPLAQLSVVSGPMRIWMEGSQTRLKTIQVKVGNRGRGEASEVRVIASIRGQLFNLQGPNALSSGKVAQYSGPADISITDNDLIQMILSCANCAR